MSETTSGTGPATEPPRPPDAHPSDASTTEAAAATAPPVAELPGAQVTEASDAPAAELPGAPVTQASATQASAAPVTRAAGAPAAEAEPTELASAGGFVSPSAGQDTVAVPQTGQAASPVPTQQYPAPYPAQPTRQYPAQPPYPGQQNPGAQNPGAQNPGAQYPGQQYPGQQYPGQQQYATPHHAYAAQQQAYAAHQQAAYQQAAQPNGGQQRGDSPWWANDAASDPWRDPGSAPAWVAPVPPPPPGPPAVGAPPSSSAPQRGMGQLIGVVLVSALLAGLLGGALGYVAAARLANPVSLGNSETSTPALAKRPPDSVAGIAQKVQPSVVTITIRASGGSSIGSGFIISDNGFILTNNHVVEAGATAGVTPQVVFQDGTAVAAKIIGRDPGSDVAVIKVEKTGLPKVTYADSDKIAVGDPVIAFGSPLGLTGTVTSGIVSAVDRPVSTGDESSAEEAYMAAIQTDASINPGNSGGPLVDGEGRVVGIDSAIDSIPGPSGRAGSIGLGFAIPMNQAKRTAEQLIATGKAKTTVIGAVLDRSKTQQQTGGVKITEVPDGPAKDAGLKPGDVITKFDNRVIGDAVDLIALIRKHEPGQKVSITYERDGHSAVTTITLQAKTVE